MKFLIVDDSKAMRRIMQKTLRSAGYVDHEYRESADGREALDLVDAWQPDLVLTDWHMPEMDGLALLKAVRSRGGRTKIGLVTTERSEAKIKEAVGAGAAFVVTKPFTVASLQKEVMQVLDGDGVSPAERAMRLLPDLALVQDTFSKLFSLETEVTVEAPGPLQVMPFVVAMYSNGDTARLDRLAVCDLKAACYLGSALTQVHPSVSFQAFRSKTLPQALFDNMHEVMNVCAGLFYNAGAYPDARLRAVHLITQPNARLSRLMADPTLLRLDLTVQVEGYGSGRTLWVVL